MLAELDDYNWEEAFQFADGFDRDDVARIIHQIDGANDYASWILVGQLTDDRFVYLSAWCDYTGWG